MVGVSDTDILIQKIQDCYAMTIKGGVKGDMVCTWDTHTFPFLPNQVCHCAAILYLLRTFGVAALSLTAMVNNNKNGKRGTPGGAKKCPMLIHHSR